MGEKTAELFTIKQKTLIEETVRDGLNRALEELKSDLEKRNIAFQIDYTFFNTERSKACIGLYRKLIDLYTIADQYVLQRGFGPSISIFEKQENDYDVADDDIMNYIDYNRILIPQSICTTVADFVTQIRICFLTARAQGNKGIKAKEETEKVSNENKTKMFAIQEEINVFADVIRNLIQPQESLATPRNQ